MLSALELFVAKSAELRHILIEIDSQPNNYIHGHPKILPKKLVRMSILQFLSERIVTGEERFKARKLGDQIMKNSQDFERSLKNVKEFRIRLQNVPKTIADRLLNFKGFALPAREQMAFGGFKHLTVDQYYTARHRHNLRHPYLPCFKDELNEKATDFFPLEFIDVIVESI